MCVVNTAILSIVTTLFSVYSFFFFLYPWVCGKKTFARLCGRNLPSERDPGCSGEPSRLGTFLGSILWDVRCVVLALLSSAVVIGSLVSEMVPEQFSLRVGRRWIAPWSSFACEYVCVCYPTRGYAVGWWWYCRMVG